MDKLIGLKNFSVVLVVIIFMPTSDVMAYMAPVVLTLRSNRDGVKLQFRIWIVLPRYLSYFTFSISLSSI